VVRAGFDPEERQKQRFDPRPKTDLKQGLKLFFELKVGLASDDPDVKLGVGLSW
jgi:hypothetical protein